MFFFVCGHKEGVGGSGRGRGEIAFMFKNG
jgi:hypothetical protein